MWGEGGKELRAGAASSVFSLHPHPSPSHHQTRHSRDWSGKGGIRGRMEAPLS